MAALTRAIDDDVLSTHQPHTMPTPEKTPIDTPTSKDLEKLHGKVDAMLDMPMPSAGDSLPMTTDVMPVDSDELPESELPSLKRAGAT